MLPDHHTDFLKPHHAHIAVVNHLVDYIPVGLLSGEQSHPARYRSAYSPYAHAAYSDSSLHRSRWQRCARSGPLVPLSKY
jgi:hypothetical protein